MAAKRISVPNCRLCGAGTTQQSIRAQFVYGGQDFHKFWNCAACDAVYLYPAPSEEEEERFYRQEFEKFMCDRSGEDRDWSNAKAHIQTNQDQVNRRWPFLAPYVKAGMALLELGCSSGFMLNRFREEGLKCVGIELSGGFLEFLHANGHEAYQTIQELESRGKRHFDLIVHFFVLEHIRHPFKFFEESLGLLKPGGKIIAEVPCVNDPLTSLYHIPAFEQFYWSVAHHFYYRPKSLKYLMDKLGVTYEMVADQRYDLSNHITWMTEGKPGGQGRYSHVFSNDLIEKYKSDLKAKWICDTIFLIVYK